jgi:hypothetical protein
MKTDREQAFGENEVEYYWCLHCERAYHKNELRTVVDEDGFIMEVCHYTDCDGDAVIDAWDWEKIREMHPEYPEKPEEGKIYPMYD